MARTADTQPQGPEPPRIGACRSCGRAVHETVHTRTTFVVDGFVLHTGPTEPTAVRRADSDEVAFVYQRLLQPVRLVTCATCFRDAAARAAHLSWTQPDD